MLKLDKTAENVNSSFLNATRKRKENVKTPLNKTVTPAARFFETQLLARTGCFLDLLNKKIMYARNTFLLKHTKGT